MANHRWKDVTVLSNITKTHECVNCGITRHWLYGDYQCWKYVWPVPHTNADGSSGLSFKESLERPECVRVVLEKEKNCPIGNCLD